MNRVFFFHFLLFLFDWIVLLTTLIIIGLQLKHHDFSLFSQNFDFDVAANKPTTIAGDKKRAERLQLNSADGDTGEKHDQFYRDHKLLLVLFRALAVMPITRSSPGL